MSSNSVTNLIAPTPSAAVQPHTAHFYESEPSLLTAAADFLQSGVLAGQSLVIIATERHLRMFARELSDRGVDLTALQASSRAFLIDADAALARILVAGVPDEQLFNATIGSFFQKQVRPGPVTIRAFGEAVDLLWQRGQRDAAIRLEELWHRLLNRVPFELLCAYSMTNFFTEIPGGPQFEDVCTAHTHVTVSQRPLPEGRTAPAPVAALARRAQALESELRARRELETALRDVLAERTRVETELRRTEGDLRDFLENAPDGMHWVGPSGTILWANAAELQMLGYTAEEYIGHHIAEFHADQDVIDDMLSRLHRNQALRDYEASMRCKDGSLRHVQVNSSVFWQNGEFVHTRCITRDITAQKRIAAERERAIRHLAAEHAVTRLVTDRRPFPEVLRELLGTIGEVGDWQLGALWMVDEPAQILRCVEFWRAANIDAPLFETTSRATTFARLAGLPGRIWASGDPEWIVDVNADHNFPRATAAERARIHTAVGFPIRIGQQVFGVLEFFSRQRRKPDVDLLQLFDSIGNRIGHFISQRQIAEKTAAEKERTIEQMDKLRAAAEAASRAKDDFLAVLGHELRNPLAAILTAVELMRLHANGLLEKERSIIDRQAQHLVRLVDDMLDVSRIGRGLIELRPECVELADIVRRSIETTEGMLERRRIELRLDVPSCGLAIEADPARLGQIVMNLLGNAAKFVEPGGCITVKGWRDGSDVCLSVSDDGVGIDGLMLTRIFEMFTQDPQTLERSRGGLGLGLTIVRSLVELHGGTVSAVSEGRGKGAEFIVRLPAFETKPPQQDRSAEAAESSTERALLPAG